MENKNALVLPIAIVSPTDIARIIRESDNLDEFFRQSNIKESTTQVVAPRYSKLLDELVVLNNLDLSQQTHRDYLKQSLISVSENSPVLHVSFSVDPPGPYVQKIVNWLRQNIRSDVLVSVGLQPNIGAGCIVRTTNKSFDFSLRKFFDSKHDFFMEKLHQVVDPEINNTEIEYNQKATQAEAAVETQTAGVVS